MIGRRRRRIEVLPPERAAVPTRFGSGQTGGGSDGAPLERVPVEPLSSADARDVMAAAREVTRDVRRRCDALRREADARRQALEDAARARTRALEQACARLVEAPAAEQVALARSLAEGLAFGRWPGDLRRGETGGEEGRA